MEAAKERKQAAFREGRHAREALRKARLTETQLETRTVEFRLELTKRRAQYEKMVSDRIMAEAAEAAAKEAAEDEKRKAEERRKRYEEAARAEYEAEVAERQAKRNALALAERAAAPFFKQQKVILKDSGTLATVLNIRKTFGRKGTPDYLPGMRLAIGSDLRVWRPFKDVEPWVYAPTHRSRGAAPAELMGERACVVSGCRRRRRSGSEGMAMRLQGIRRWSDPIRRAATGRCGSPRAAVAAAARRRRSAARPRSRLAAGRRHPPLGSSGQATFFTAFRVRAICSRRTRRRRRVSGKRLLRPRRAWSASCAWAGTPLQILWACSSCRSLCRRCWRRGRQRAGPRRRRR